MEKNSALRSRRAPICNLLDVADVHSVAEREEPVALLHGYFIGVERLFAPEERADEPF